MLIILLVLRLGLSVVFGVAGVAKLMDRPGTRDAVTNFGAPASWSGPLAWLLPLGEIAIALGLLFSASTWASALAALLLLCIFIAAIGLNLSRGRAPECHCFGQLYSRPLGWPTLVRNMVFAACAGFVIWQGQQIIQSSTLLLAEKLGGTQYFPLVAFLAMAIVVATVVYFQRAHAQSARAAAQNQPAPAPQGLPLGAQAPAFQLPAYRREETSLAELLEPGKPLLLIFSNPKCGPCSALFSELGEWQRTYPGQVTVAVLTQGTIKDNFVHIARNDLQNILFQNEREVAEAYQANATPTGILVSPDGRIASAPAGGADNIRAVIQSTLESQGVPLVPHDSHVPALLPQTQSAD
jgi:thiol-disulfide isomerase/thioredoxin